MIHIFIVPVFKIDVFCLIKFENNSFSKYHLGQLFRSQVNLLITNNAFCIVQRATAQSKTGIFRGYGVAEAPPGFQAGWSDCV
jgi:hypothetical protein